MQNNMACTPFYFCSFLIHSSLICSMLTNIQLGNKQLKKKSKVKSYVQHHTVGMPQLFFTICNFNIGHQFEHFVAPKTAQSCVLARNLQTVYEMDQIFNNVDFLNVLRSKSDSWSIGSVKCRRLHHSLYYH